MVLNLLLTVFALYLLYTLLRGAPFLPTKSPAVETMVSLAKIQPGEKAVDLGSGDGRIVIALALAGAIAHGYETNFFLVWLSRRKIRKLKLQNQAFIHWRSFWNADLSDYSIVTVFGIDYIMKKLGGKLDRELPHGARVLSNVFTFPGWKMEQKNGTIYLYIR